MRNRTGLLATAALTVVLAGCGSPAAPVAKATQNPTAAASASSSPSATATPVATAVPTPTPKPAPPALIVLTQTTSSTETIRLVGLDGTTVASTTLPGGSIRSWVKAGPDGAYWLDTAGTLHRLGRDGATTTVATLPGAEFFAVGPGDEVAYQTETSTSPAADGQPEWDNRLYLLASGSTRLLADRSSTGSLNGGPSTAGIPPYDWYYDPVGWTDSGLLIARLPQGGCGCGSFGMESVQGYTGVVDAASGVAGSVTNDTSCPLSGIAGDGTEACFHTPEVRTSKNEGLGADALRIVQNGAVTQTFSLSTQNAAGDATFSPDATELAYATSPAGLDCGTWAPQTTLRVLNLGTGNARPIGPQGLQPVAWLPDGRILASDTTGTQQVPEVGAAIVDPATGTVQRVPSTQSANNTQLLGLVTA